jgi:hypothetical protein
VLFLVELKVSTLRNKTGIFFFRTHRIVGAGIACVAFQLNGQLKAAQHEAYITDVTLSSA